MIRFFGALIGLAALVVVALTGCSGEAEAENAPVVVEAPVDPRYATADALVAHYNDLNAQAIPDFRALSGLWYAENDTQRRILSVLRSFADVMDFYKAVIERYQVALDAAAFRELAGFKQNARATIKQRLDRRVIADHVDFDGARSEMHFVEYDRRWWISGYSFESNKNLKKMLDNPSFLDAMDAAGRMFRAAATKTTARVRAGEFANAQAAMASLIAAFDEYANANPSDARLLTEFAKANPNFGKKKR
jgi:hypothetical protein